MTFFYRRAVCALLIAFILTVPTAARAANLTLAWDPETSVAGFIVLYGTQSGVYTTSVGAGTATQLQITGLVSGMTYYFVVESYDTSGNKSAPSTEVAGVPVGMSIACPAPSGTSATGSAIALTFSPTVSGGTAPINTLCTPASGSSFPVGVNPLTCSATDATGQTASCSSSVLVVGSTAPSVAALSISCPAIATTFASSGLSTNVVYGSPTVTGGVAPLTTSCTPSSGSQFAIGTTTVSCTVQDAAQHSASCTTTATVTTSAAAPPPPTKSTSFSGTIVNLTGKCPSEKFTVGSYVVTTSAATTYTQRSCNSLGNGKTITIVGILQTSGSVAATSISFK